MKYEFLIEVYKSVVMFLLTVFTGVSILTYNILIQKAPVFMSIFVGIGILIISIGLYVLLELSKKLLKEVNEKC